MAKGDVYYLRGNTYPHRGVIRSIGGRWDAEAKAWIVRVGSMRMRQRQSMVIHLLRRQGVEVSSQ